MEKNLYLRIDIDSYIGLTKGVPILLKLFEKHKVKATFFLTFDREGNLLEYLKYKLFRKKEKAEIEDFPNSKLKKLSQRKKEVLQILFWPKGLHKETQILEQIINDGHDLEIHCFNHVLWSNPKYQEALKDLNKAHRLHRKITNQKAKGFCSPYGSFNKPIAKVIRESDFQHIAIHNKEKIPTICHETGKLNIPLTIFFTKKLIPPCEYFAKKGYRKNELVQKVINHTQKETSESKFNCTYIHPRIEGVELLEEFSQYLAYLSKNFNMTHTFSDLIKNYGTN